MALRNMKKLLTYLTLLLATLSLVGCHEDPPVVEPVTPVITAQSIISGALDISTEPQKILILFKREIELVDPSCVTLTPSVPLEVVADSVKLTIQTLEKMAYDTEYELRIGAGAVVDKATDAPNLDRSIIFRTEEGPHTPPDEITVQLATPNPLPVVQELYSFLWSLYGRATLSGAKASLAWDLNECDWINRYTGNYPVVAAFDYQYLHHSPSSSLNYGDITPTEKWWSEGGVVAIDWHWMVPAAEGSRQYTYLREETTATVANMLKEGTWENAQMMQDLKEVADMLLLLQAKKIPVLWRPLPDTLSPKSASVGSGEYYWWCGAEPRDYKALWRKMFDYFAERGVKNLIWVWTSQVENIEYYPGDEWVDMVALELYNMATMKDINALSAQLDKDFPHKMVSLGEFGNLPTMDMQLSEGIAWSYFVPHSDQQNNYTEGFAHSYATIDWWRASFADSRVLSRSAVTLLKSYQAVRALAVE